MYRIYLDWNIITALKNPKKVSDKQQPIYEALLALLQTHRARLWIPYSVAHLRDLGRGYDPDDARKVRYTYHDLAFLLWLTGGMCLDSGFKQDKPRKVWRDPFEYFEALQANEADGTGSYEGLVSLFTESETPGIKELGGVLMNLWDSQPMLYPENMLPTIDRMFPNWKEKESMSGLLRDVYTLMHRVQHDFTYTKELRELLDSSIPGLSPLAVSSAAPADAFAKIDQIVAPMLGCKSFMDLLQSSQTTNSTKPKTEWDEFIHDYYMLDMMGYRRDEANAKKHFPNTMDDITHAYMAAHCDIFVAEDNRLRAKAEAVYERKKLGTLVLTPEQAVAELTKRMDQEYTATNFVAIWQAALRDAIQEERKTTWELGLDGFDYYYLGWLFLDRFSIVGVARNTAGSEIHLQSWKNTYADSIMPEEMAALVTVLVNCLGPDSAGLGLLRAGEWANCTGGTWEGRTWNFKTLLFRLELTLEDGLVFIYRDVVQEPDAEPELEATPEPAATGSWWQQLTNWWRS